MNIINKLSNVALLSLVALIFLVSGSTYAADSSRPIGSPGPTHTNKLYKYNVGASKTRALSEITIKILINTGGHGNLTGVSPIDEKDYWLQLLYAMNQNYQVDWYDGIPSYNSNIAGDLNLYDMVIYDAGGYWYPLSNEVGPLSQFHHSGRPLIVVAPDLNYDFVNIQDGSVPGFIENVLHVGGVRGILPEDAFSIIANTGHEMVSSMGTGIEIPIASNSSFPDSFSPLTDAAGVLRQGAASIEFDRGTIAQDPLAYSFGASGNLYSVIAYPGSITEGRVVLFGFPPTAIQNSSNLDQLCQNAINYSLGKVEQNKQVKLENFYVDDAGDRNLSIYKAKGDYLELVHVISNGEADSQNLTITTTVPNGWEFQKWYMRNDSKGSNNQNHEDLHTKQEDGKHVIQVGNIAGSKTLQIGIRFKIPDNSSTGTISVSSKLSLADGLPLVSSQSAAVTVVSSVQAIIVTNRNNLYSIYGDANKDTTELLKTLFSIADGKESGEVSAVVYYADWYSDDIKNWNNRDGNLYDGTPNNVADVLDGLIEGWVSNLNPWFSSGPQYLLIVGGDKVIPFYRIEDLLGTESSHTDTDVNSNNYYLSDMKYADTSGNDYMKGEIELATGRIEGATTKDMRDFITRGITGPADSAKAFIGSDKRNDVDDVLENLKEEEYAILNESGDSITVEKDSWSKSEFTTALSDNINIFAHSGHGDEAKFYAGDLTFIQPNDIPSLTTLRPFISTSGCHSGQAREIDTVSSDNMLWRFINKGASGYLGSGALVYLNGDNGKLAYGERLFNDFFKALSDFWTKDDPFGKALKQAVKSFDVGFYWQDIEKRTVTQFIYYGLPWMKPNFPPSSNKSGMKGALATIHNGFTITESIPKQITKKLSIGKSILSGSYSKTYTFNVNDYNISSEGDFDVVRIPGSVFDFNAFEPILPKLMATLNLPKDSSITAVLLNGGHTQSLGKLNIPNSQPSTTADPKPGFTEITDVTGQYPAVNYGYDIDNYADHVEVKIYFVPVQHNVESNDTLLWTDATVEVQYDLTQTVLISGFSSTGSEFLTTETISSSLTVENAGGSSVSNLSALLEIINAQGIVQNSIESAVGNVPAGGKTTIGINISNGLGSGNYMLKLSLKDGTASIVGISSTYIKVFAEGINAFTIPQKTLNTGIDIPFTIYFNNFNQNNVNADAQIKIYNENGKQVAQLFVPTVNVSAQSSMDIVAYWNSLEKPPGVYSATAFVAVGNNNYTVNSQFTIEGSGLLAQGWNLFSLYREPANNNIAQVLSSIEGKYASIWAYANGTWTTYDPDFPGGSDLATITSGKGYWILMSEWGAVEHAGSGPSSAVPLSSGWNLVGYSKATALSIADAMTSINGKYVSVWAFRNGNWKVYDPEYPSVSDLIVMEPGYGYWINAKENCTWTLP